MKNIIYLLIISITFIACEKSDAIRPRTLKGKYDISNYSQSRTYLHCSDNFGMDGLVTEVSNPGRIYFTGKKTIQASANSLTNKTYIGYFEYDYIGTDGNGRSVPFVKDELFQYGFEETCIGCAPSTNNFIFFYFNKTRYFLELTFDANNNITSFTQIGEIDCGKEYFVHEVEN